MAVYFIRAGEDGPVKIGSADDIAGRFRELQCGNHLALTVIREIAGGQGEERWLHCRFANARIRGEWFRLLPEMLTIVPPAILKPEWYGGFRALIAKWPSIEALADDTGASLDTAMKWRVRDSIPPRLWMHVVRGAEKRGLEGITFDVLDKLFRAQRPPQRPQRVA